MSAEAPRLETPCQVKSGTVVSHDAIRPCRDITVARQGVWHARGNRATADGVTPAVVCGHRLGDSVAPRVGEGRNTMVKRGRCASWCLSPLMVEMALQGESRSRGVSLLPP